MDPYVLSDYTYTYIIKCLWPQKTALFMHLSDVKFVKFMSLAVNKYIYYFHRWSCYCKIHLSFFFWGYLYLTLSVWSGVLWGSFLVFFLGSESKEKITTPFPACSSINNGTSGKCNHTLMCVFPSSFWIKCCLGGFSFHERIKRNW